MKDKIDEVKELLGSEEMSSVLRVQSTAMKSITDFMHDEGFVQLMPVMVSPVTDPLCHSVYDARIDYAGQELTLTKSMILHKQVTVSSPFLPKIYVVSPNVRLEKEELRDSGRHLIEFSQVDIEMREASKEEFMGVMEKLLCKIVGEVKAKRGKELKALGRELKVPKRPFKRFESSEARKEFGSDFEKHLSETMSEPFWITDHLREFYDREDHRVKDYYHNYDLVYPEGFGEALSGGERDWEYEVLARKLEERKQKQESFRSYMEMAKRGYLVPSAGGGIGVERLVRFLCGVDDIRKVSPFAKCPGETFVF